MSKRTTTKENNVTPLHTATKASSVTKINAGAEGVDARPEYQAGYNAFMRRCAGYALAHADDSDWEAYWAAGQDDQPETPDYAEGWLDAKARIVREAKMDMGGAGNPRVQTAIRKLRESGAAPNGIGISLDDDGLTILTPLAAKA